MATTNTNLYRAIIDGTIDGPLVDKGRPVEGVLYPRFEDSTYIDGAGKEQTSAADVTLYKMATGDEVGERGGTSMFDVEGWFGFAEWRYFHVPNETEYPDNLFIRKGRRKRKNKSGTLSGRHYQIEPRTRITVEAYKGALDNFARNAVVRQVALAKSE